MIKKTLILVLISLVFWAGYLVYYLGAFREVAIETAVSGPYLLLSIPHQGAYHYIGQKIEQVEAFALKQNLNCPQTFGEYLDNPEAVDQDRLRSRAGCVLTASPTVALPEGMKFEERPARRYVVATFDGSPSIGPFKVYPRVTEYLQLHRLKADGPVIELYRVNGKRVFTTYLFPVLK